MLWIPSTECEIADLVTQFFIARTSSAGTVRMDPQFKRKAHREWFLDGLGYLRIAKCFISPIKHAFAECDGRSKAYMKFRGKIGKKDESEETQMSNRRLWHYRSAFNCMHND